MKVDFRGPIYADFDLPEEIWSNIFRHLDKKSLRNAQMVCKNWLQIILNDVILSGKSTLAAEKGRSISQNDVDTFISKRPKLKVLRCPNTMFFLRIGTDDPIHKLTNACYFPSLHCDLRNVDYSNCKDLKKVISSYFMMPKMDQLPEWTYVITIWFDPHNIPSKFEPKNVIQLGIKIKSEHSYVTDQSLEPIGSQMVHLEKLFFSFSRSCQSPPEFCIPLLKGLQACDSLKQLEICLDDDELEYSTSLRYVNTK